MTCSFNIFQLDILNALVFDASIGFDELNNLTTLNPTIEFNIERRQIENVTRKKMFFWTWTYLKGKKSLLQFTDIHNCTVTGITAFKDNHFIDSIVADTLKTVIITTSFGLTITLTVGDNFTAVLNDIQDSNFGEGISFGKLGYTDSEWMRYLDGHEYSPRPINSSAGSLVRSLT